MNSDLEIARQATLLPIADIAAQAGLIPSEIELNGPHKAKVRLDALRRLETSAHPKGKLVVVTAITPTPLGEGKTVTTIGASLGLASIGKSVVTCIRQPSMGPVFGIKGGAAGGGHSQVVPMEDFNLHLTGDIHAIQAAHNLAAAALDSRLFHETRLGPEKFTARTSLPFLDIDPARILWNRVLDINDRSLRSIEIGLPFPGADPAAVNDNGVPRHAGFDIAVASELMAILALASDLGDLRQRVGRVILALDRQGRPVTAERLGVAGAMTILMRDTVKPTLLQTLERTPCLVHAGPFANIAHGNSSIIADRLALRLADYVVTESGFGSDMGFEKFCNVKTRVSGQPPAAVVLVATLRALKMHSGQFRVIPGRPLPNGILSENSEALDAGLANLDAHIANARQFGVPVVVALNHFPTDTPAEIARVRQHALAAGAFAAVTSQVHAKGGEGGRELAEAIVAAADSPSSFRLLYPDDLPLVEKIRTIATSVYGASDINLFPQATAALAAFQAAGHGHLPVCMAKTHLSLSHDPARPGAPKDYIFPIREAHLSAGAGFIYVLADKIRTMPGLGSTPAYLNMDIDPDGNITGLS